MAKIGECKSPARDQFWKGLWGAGVATVILELHITYIYRVVNKTVLG